MYECGRLIVSTLWTLWHRQINSKFNYIGISSCIGSIFIIAIPIWEKLTDADTDVSWILYWVSKIDSWLIKKFCKLSKWLTWYPGWILFIYWPKIFYSNERYTADTHMKVCNKIFKIYPQFIKSLRKLSSQYENLLYRYSDWATRHSSVVSKIHKKRSSWLPYLEIKFWKCFRRTRDRIYCAKYFIKSDLQSICRVFSFITNAIGKQRNKINAITLEVILHIKIIWSHLLMRKGCCKYFRITKDLQNIPLV